MAFPLVLGIGIAVTITATTVAWLFDSATEEEHARHDKLREEAEQAREQIRANRTAHSERLREELRQTATHHRDILLKELARLASEHEDVVKEVEKLERSLAQELTNEQQNPFRRRTLLQSAMRIEDARARLDAHCAYRDDLAATLERSWQRENYEAVLELDPPTFAVPVEWLYVGKMLLIEVPTELDQPLKFRQRLHLRSEKLPQGFSDARQRKFMADYPDSTAVPIQVFKQDKKNPKKFFGCIARGITHIDHLRTQAPVEFRVDHYQGASNSYIGELFEGSILATLPSNRLPDPGERLRPGQTVPVWLDVYDLLLSKVPSVKTSRERSRILVNARPPAQANPRREWLALVVSEVTSGAEALDEIHALNEWRLSAFDEVTGRLQLINGRNRVHCEIDPKRHLLVAEHCEKIPENIDGFAIPLLIEPCDAQLADFTYLQSPEGVEYLQQIALQMQHDPKREKLRAQQACFLERWREILDYQQEEENRITIEFTGIVQADTSESWRLSVSQDNELDGELKEWAEAYQQIAEDNTRFKTTLEMWRAVERDGELEEGWQPVVWKHSLDVVTASPDNIELAFNARRGPVTTEFQEQKPRRYRLTVEQPDEALKRQREALESFANDRMVEPMLKEVLLAPGCDQAAIDAAWSERVEMGLDWRNPALTPTQRQVIKSCMKAARLALVQGPPGTAKTTCIVEMLHQIFAASPTTRVLVVSQQNAAVDNALDRFIESGGLDDGHVRLLRIGNEKRIEPKLLSYALSTRMSLEYRRCLDAAQCHRQNENPAIADLAQCWEQLVKGLQQQAEANEKHTDSDFAELLLNGHNLVGATCVGLANQRMGLDRLTFDVAIIDEAGRATVPELLIPLLRTRKVILIGDHHQLPPTVAPLLREEKTREELPFLDDAFLQSSFFETLFRSLPSVSRAQLREQYRMAPAIGDLVADLFYTEDGIRTLVNGERKPDSNEPEPLLEEPLGWITILGRQERDGKSKSWRNLDEARAIARFLAELAPSAEALGGKDVAVITPYRAQVHCITKELRRLKNCEGDNQSLSLGGLRIKIDTVDSFQGSEANLVCYSTVRTQGSLQFILDEKRLNVACSRAQENLIFFGHSDYLLKHRPRNQRNLFAEILPRTVPPSLERAARVPRIKNHS